MPLITLTSTPRWAPIVLLHHIPPSLHRKLALLQYAPEFLVPGIRKLQRPQLGLVPYPRIAPGVQQYLDNRVPVRGPLGLVERVDVAHGFVQRRVVLHAVGLVDLEAFLVEEDVEDFVCVAR
jgi:hypothetical protein